MAARTVAFDDNSTVQPISGPEEPKTVMKVIKLRIIISTDRVHEASDPMLEPL